MTCRAARSSVASAAVAFALGAAGASAQTSTGTISGVVRDPSGAAVVRAEVLVTSEQTGAERTLVTSEGGRYAAAMLTPGAYTVSARRPPLRSGVQAALVQSGMNSTLDLVISLDGLSEALTVSASSRLRNDHHQVTGWVDRLQIDTLPLNGRSVLELAKVEPGVAAPARLTGGRLFISALGAGLNAIPRVGFTRITVDGANIETPGSVGSLLQIPPEAVDQMQVSTANLDIASGAATSGAVDVITRSGGNAYTFSAFSLYRDRQWSSPAAGPAAAASSPPFRRYQGGTSAGGPLRSNRVFFFAGFERHEQRDVIEIAPTDSGVRELGGTFASPYSGTLMHARVDVHFTPAHRAFLRHTRDDNDSLTSADGGPSLPSGWAYRPVLAHQTLLAITSVLSPTVVNQLRVSSYATHQSIDPVAAGDCPPPCAGFGAPRILLTDGGPTALAVGTAPRNSSRGRRLQVSETVVWQKSSHLLRLGFDWEHTRNSVFLSEHDPVTLTLWAPATARQLDPAVALPASLSTVEDFLRLPLRSFTTSVGSGAVPQRGFQPVRQFNTFRWFAGDQWSLGSRLTANMGLAWSFEPGVLNDDLPKPDWLAPLVGTTRLDAPAHAANLSATAGAAWRATSDGRTIVRAGAGRYVESMGKTVALNLANERTLLSPLGTGRLIVSGANLSWNGRRLNFPQPTAFTGADLLAILPAIRASIEQSLSPDNRDYSVVNLDQTKEGRNLYDPSYTTPRAFHASVGVERQIRGNIVVSADLVGKWFSHTFINGIDYNRFNSAQGPVIPACTAAQRTDVTVICSNGSLYFDTTSGRARYLGVLVRAEQRLSASGRLLASYAYGRFVGNNGTGTGTTETSDGRVFGFNNDDWSENFGPLPTDIRHALNLSGVFTGPWSLSVSFNLAAYGRAPFSAYVAGMDFNGDGTTNDLLPGTRVNQFNRGLDRDDLVRLVSDYNARYAGRLTGGRQVAPAVTLPSEFEFNDAFFALDVRVARAFHAGRSLRLSAFVDVFNVFDTMNMTGYNGNLLAPNTFGRPTRRLGQAFGSGGPRSAQLGLRIGF